VGEGCWVCQVVLTRGSSVLLLLLPSAAPRATPAPATHTPQRQVLMNLVRSSLRLTQRGAVRISASQTHDAAQVVVADTGAGMTPAQLRTALDPFAPPEAGGVRRAGCVCAVRRRPCGCGGTAAHHVRRAARARTPHHHTHAQRRTHARSVPHTWLCRCATIMTHTGLHQPGRRAPRAGREPQHD
jgi:endonuclease/exonuclease/phosphatase (EEP) superfamily protein YafD